MLWGYGFSQLIGHQTSAAKYLPKQQGSSDRKEKLENAGDEVIAAAMHSSII